jgi:hypothetical protein
MGNHLPTTWRERVRGQGAAVREDQQWSERDVEPTDEERDLVRRCRRREGFEGQDRITGTLAARREETW